MKKLLEHRKALKDRKPHFLKQDTHKKPGIAKKWGRPRGIDSKMRLHLRGYRIMVSKGWKSPSEVKGLHPSGLTQKLVHNTSEAEKLDAKKDGLIIAATVGDRKRIEIIRVAQKLGLKILNIKDPEKYITETESGVASRKKAREERKEAAKKRAETKPKKAKKEEKEQKEESPKSVEDLASEEETRQDAEKREKEKILTKRE
jgi:large subunit ribosomal protein L32e